MVEAARYDFSQYGLQKLLYLELCNLILGEDATVYKDPGGEGVWIAVPPEKRMRFVDYHDLGDYLIKSLETRPLSGELLAAVCQRVFRTKAHPGQDDSGKREGIWVETGLEGFECRQCGRCCQTLEYHDGCTIGDYQNWERGQRSDIMEWVRPITQGGEIVACRIWVTPGTNQYAETCPWLRKIPDRNYHECRIYDVRPEICRQYPATRKHAEMTGCTGFRTSQI